MFNVGGGEFIVIALIALIVLGPQRLPGAARQVGKVLGDVRRLSSGFQSEMRDAFADVDADVPAASGGVAARGAPDSDRAATASVDAAVAAAGRPGPRRRAPLRAAPAGARAPLPKGSTARGKGA